MVPKSKKVGVLASKFENGSAISLQPASEQGRPSALRTLSQISRVLSPIPGNELTHIYNSFQTPRGEQRRYFTAPSSTSLSSTANTPFRTPDTTKSEESETRSSSSLKSLDSFHTATMRQTVKKAVKGLGFRSPTTTSNDTSSTSSQMMSPIMAEDENEDDVLRPYVQEDGFGFRPGDVGTAPPVPRAGPDQHARGIATADRTSQEEKHTQVALQSRSKQETDEQIGGRISRGLREHQDTYKLDLPHVQGLGIHINEEIDAVGRKSCNLGNIDSTHTYGLGIRLKEDLCDGPHAESKEVSSEALTGYTKKEDALDTAQNTVNSSKSVEQANSQEVRPQEDPYFGLEALGGFGGESQGNEQPQNIEREGEDVFAPNFYTTRAVARRTLLLERPDLVRAYRLRNGGGRASVRTPEVAAAAPRQDSDDEDEDIFPSGSNSKPSIETLDTNNLELIDEFLEDNYRAQVSLPTRSTSSASRFVFATAKLSQS
jgi:hypothetical protein